MLLAMFFKIVVLPAFGGETIMARWPMPIGENRSIMRAEIEHLGYSRVKRLSGKIGVKFSNGILSLACSGSVPLMASIFNKL